VSAEPVGHHHRIMQGTTYGYIVVIGHHYQKEALCGYTRAKNIELGEALNQGYLMIHE
jgi:hypothetical protein